MNMKKKIQMNDTMTFHLGDILSITTTKLVSPTLMDGVYSILNFMTNDNLWTHQLPRAGDECRPYLLEQFPALMSVDASGVNRHNWGTWLAEQVAEFGEWHEVERIPPNAHERKRPIEEVIEMRGSDEGIISFEISTDDEPSPYGDLPPKSR